MLLSSNKAQFCSSSGTGQSIRFRIAIASGQLIAAQADIATNTHYLRQIAANSAEMTANTERTVGFFERIANRQREPEVRAPSAPRVIIGDSGL